MPFLGGFLRQTRIVYPLQVGDWKIEGGEHLYELREYGVSVRYRDSKHDGRWIDLYFYPAGVLNKDDFERAAADEIGHIHAAEAANMYHGVKIGQFQPFGIKRPDDDKTSAIDARSVGMSYSKDGHIEHSAMTLLLDSMYFVKGRLSLPERDLSVDDTRKLLEQFADDVMPLVRIHSTGGCWMPLPIEALRSGQSPPSGTLMSNQVNGKTTAYLLKDRVLAPDPKSLQAYSMMMMGMAMAGHLFDGCIPPADINQEVHDGEREIRLEYLPPADGAPDGPNIHGSDTDTGTG